MISNHIQLVRYVILALLSFFFLVLPSVADAERISTFKSDIEIHEDGSFTVTEEITYNFFEQERHGIYRNIPKTHPQKPRSFLFRRWIEIELKEVLFDGRPATYFDESTKDTLSIRIGDPDITITGTHTYTIVYTVYGGLSRFPSEGVTELNWNVTGHDWDAPITRGIATVSAPEGYEANTRSCYVGAYGETRSCIITTDDEGEVRFNATEIIPGEGLTVAQRLTHGVVPVVVYEEMKMIYKFISVFAGWLVLLIYFGIGYKMRNKTYRSIVTQFEPYKDVKPMLSGVLRDNHLHPQDVTAGILHLAERGFLKIHATKEKVLFFSVSEHEVELMRPISEAEGQFDRWLLELLFEPEDMPGKKIKLSDLRHNVVKSTENRKTLREIRKKAHEDLTAAGYYEEKPGHYPLSGIAVIGAAVVMFFMAPALELEYLLYAAPFVLTFGITLLLLWPRMTKKGFDAVDHLKGFETFLSVTGEKRFEFHNAPQNMTKENPRQFLEYLPFAIAFGVEDEWAEVFKDVTIPAPEWYDGNAATFSSTSFTDGLHSFSSSFASASGGTGSSSSSSGGGGFSGGGGGGGGGGSW